MNIYWSEDGALACKGHAPAEGSESWRAGRWRALTTNEVREFERELGHAPACEMCAEVGA